MSKPFPQEYPNYFSNYLSKIPDSISSIQLLLKTYSPLIESYFQSIPKEKQDFQYAKNKWTVKEFIQHLIDCERVFAYRATCISRKESCSLPPFDENKYVTNSNAKARTFEDLINEFIHIRKSTDLLFLSFTDEQLLTIGKANNTPTSVNAICYVTIGHILHHIDILKERYLS